MFRRPFLAFNSISGFPPLNSTSISSDIWSDSGTVLIPVILIGLEPKNNLSKLKSLKISGFYYDNKGFNFSKTILDIASAT